MKNKLLEDLKAAMVNKDKKALSVIRMVKGAIQLEEINKKEELTDEEVTAIVSKQIKTRKESAVEAKNANREDLLSELEVEIEILSKYMPEQLSEEEVNKVIDEAFTSVNPTNVRDTGKLMAYISPKVKGKADLSLVSNLVREKLNSIL